MSIEKLPDACGPYAQELLRLATGQTDGPSAGLESHLDGCRRCREWLESSRDLVDRLRAALAPEPLANGLKRRLRIELLGESPRSGRAWSMPLRVACSVAAACLLAAFLVPRPSQDVELSAEDAAAIIEVDRLLRWSGPEYSMSMLFAKMDEVAQMLNREAGVRLLPWGPEEDWDLPADDSGGARPPGMGLRAPAVATVWHHRQRAGESSDMAWAEQRKKEC